MAHGAAAVLLAAFFLQSSLGIESESLTFDESGSIGSSYLAFRKHDVRLVKERPPLLGLFITLPLVLAGEPRLPPIVDPGNRVADQHFGDQLLHDVGNDTIRITRVCRYTVLVLSLVLGVALYAWATRLGGVRAGLFALFLFAFCPNLLAHSRIAANDMTCTIFAFLAMFALDRLRRGPTLARAAVAGVALGMALTAKLTSVVLLPLVALVFLLDARLRPRGGVVALVAVVTIGACMGGTFDYGTYLVGFRNIYGAGASGYLYYLGGQFSARPWWYYHLYAAGLKTPVPLLLLLPVGAVVLMRRDHDWTERLLVLGPLVAVVGASCFDPANMGLRRILPAYPFAILAAAQAVRLGLPGATRAVLFGVLAVWQAGSVLHVTPHHLSYFNELAGGPTRGMFYLDDSNIDWGQDLPSLRRWLDAHPGLPVRLDYFGTARPETYGIALPQMDEETEICVPRHAVYVVSAHTLVFFEKVSRVRGSYCSWLMQYRPVDRIAYSMYVYDFR
ncbi:MAG TPA: glycosyltransferase family 39 protein [Candidatus Binatia bacterium]|nr:glycosyltransferase family 39 protein [Candidatus Binatia bacterium]